MHGLGVSRWGWALEKKIECDDSDGSTTAMMMCEDEASEGRIEGASQTGEIVRNVRGKGTKKKRRGKERDERGERGG